MGVKLTKTQRELLETVATGHKAVRYRRRPVQALWAAGYVEFDDQAGGGLWWITITPAGRAALSHSDGGGE